MDMQTYYEQFENCLQEEKPFCADDCPFHIDILDFIDKIAANRYNAAYKILRNAVAFPDIVCRICPKHCLNRCPRKELGGEIQINTLERTCLNLAKRKDPNEYNLPAKKGKIAIIGAGLSGLSCALRLASKKYQVTVYEQSDKLGGQLHTLLSEDIINEEINRQFKFEEYILKLNTAITDIESLLSDGFDAIYIATGKNGNDFNALSWNFYYSKDNDKAICHNSTAVFAGGSLLGKDVVFAAADGLNMARAIDDYLKTGIIRYPEDSLKTKVQVDTKDVQRVSTVNPSDEIYTHEEAVAEISRCLRCQCNSCRKYCDLTNYFNKWPLQMRDDIMTTTMPANSMIRKAPAIRLINMCTQCGLCGETCPGKIELGSMIKEARRMMHKIDRMPGAYHQFWLRDMEFANSPYSALVKAPPRKTACSYAFFPGCHLGAANPLYVTKAYDKLLESDNEVGLFLKCCGVPADWAGNEEIHEKSLMELKEDWISLGKPILIMACTSCMRHFNEYLPEIPIMSLYEAFIEFGLKFSITSEENLFSIFDPCSSRHYEKAQSAVRKLLKNAHVYFEDIPEGNSNGCCGFGGNIEVASPKLAKKIADNRSDLSDNPYITYCINCRDVFHDNNKPAVHLLDILLNIEPAGDELPTVTDRRCNRVILKEKLLESIWGEAMNNKPTLKYKLDIDKDIIEKMNSQKILDEDICHVLEMGEDFGRRVFNPDKNTYTCYREIGSITCWVEYRHRESDDIYEIINVFTHRMKIELEVVFNGKKADYDLR